MSEANIPFDISVEEVKQRLDAQVPFLLLDCRTPQEYQVAKITGAHLVPMQELPARLAELPSDRDGAIVVHCHHGGRSQRVTAWLRQQGYSNAQNMAGGIDAWSERIDPSVPKY